MDLPEGYMAEVQDCNKNLGIPQRNGHHYEARGKAATAKYLHRVGKVLKSQLNVRTMTRANNTYTLPSSDTRCYNKLTKGRDRSR
ncbi:Highly reducing polyketide synthase gloL [Dissostichus eleginoides]|uniref:Highly reducing polyketide synthase gloL n=1 Tax=Dissostichus eleginoides TaxID=100907 RepID=A0AAD9CLE7_DISEL|nr:Highly reducing polyketide synthase gloL [Dissostichus eleginoides]